MTVRVGREFSSRRHGDAEKARMKRRENPGARKNSLQESRSTQSPYHFGLGFVLACPYNSHMADETSKADAASMAAITRYMEAAVERDFKPYLKLIMENFDRSMNLIKQADEMKNETSGEILRAVVVLNHAYLEDFLRTLALAFLPTADERVLDGVPLAGAGRMERAEKFYLGKLLQHKGKTVDDVIRESVSQYMEHSTFSSVTEVMSFLDSIGVRLPAKKDVKSPLELALDPALPKMLDTMMRRRHYIVHRADKAKTGDGLQAINSAEVMAGLVGTFSFMFCVTQTAFMKRHSFDEFKKRVDAMKEAYEKVVKETNPSASEVKPERPLSARRRDAEYS
jgi:hypothetical protein